MPFPLIPLALGGASFLGGLLGNRKQSTTTTQTDTPDASAFNQMLMRLVKQRLQSGTDLSGYAANGIQDINKTFGAAQTGLNAELTSRGLSDSPVAAGPLSTLQTGRAGSIAQLINSLPMLQRQQQNEDVSAGARLYEMQPRTTTTDASGNKAGGAAGSLASMLAYLYGHGAFAKTSPQVPNLFQGF